MLKLCMSKIKQLSLWLIGIGFIIAGINHFLNPDFYTAIMPPYLPYHLELVYISGVFEVLGGIGIMIPRVQKWAGWGLILLLIAVFPANLHMALNPEQFETIPTIALYLRLPLQFVLIAWIYWAMQTGDSPEK